MLLLSSFSFAPCSINVAEMLRPLRRPACTGVKHAPHPLSVYWVSPCLYFSSSLTSKLRETSPPLTDAITRPYHKMLIMCLCPYPPLWASPERNDLERGPHSPHWHLPACFDFRKKNNIIHWACVSSEVRKNDSGPPVVSVLCCVCVVM